MVAEPLIGRNGAVEGQRPGEGQRLGEAQKTAVTPGGQLRKRAVGGRDPLHPPIGLWCEELKRSSGVETRTDSRNRSSLQALPSAGLFCWDDSLSVLVTSPVVRGVGPLLQGDQGAQQVLSG